MSVSEKLPIPIENLFEELPHTITAYPAVIERKKIEMPQVMFDPKIQGDITNLNQALMPMVVQAKNDTSFEIIDGSKRLHFYRRKRYKKVACWVLSASLDSVNSGLLRIVLNHHRAFHLREKYTLVFWLKKIFPDLSYKTKAQKIGIPEKQCERILRLDRCPDCTRESFLNGIIDFSLLESFLVFSPEDQKYYLDFIQELKFSLQAQKELITWLPEIAYNGGCDVRTILNDSQIQEIRQSSSLNGPQKIEKIHSLVFKKKFPQLSEAQKVWQKHAHSLNPKSSSVSIIPHPNFEKDMVQIHITIRNPQQAKAIFKEFAQISSGSWKKLLYPL